MKREIENIGDEGRITLSDVIWTFLVIIVGASVIISGIFLHHFLTL